MTCVSGDSSEADKLEQWMQSSRKLYEDASVYLREVTGMRVFKVQLVCIFLLLLYIFALNFRTFLKRKATENVTFLEVVIEKYPMNLANNLFGES